MKSVSRMYQWAGEKAGSYQPTKLDDEFLNMSRATDDADKTIKKVLAATDEVLQPNPSTCAKMKARHAASKSSGTEYLQPEDKLAEGMIQGADTMGEDSVFATALRVAGAATTQIAQCRSQLDSDAQESFIGPLSNFRSTNIKEVKTMRKRVETRRLEYDAKGRYKDTTPKAKEDFLEAQIRFEEAKEVCYKAMVDLQDFEQEHCGQLLSYLKGQLEFHEAAASILAPAIDDLKTRVETQGPRKPRATYHSNNAPSTPPLYQIHAGPVPTMSSAGHASSNEAPSTDRDLFDDDESDEAGDKTFVVALYEFKAESDRELDLVKGDKIELLEILDSSWMEGRLNGKVGVFPVGYVTYC